MVIKVTLNVYEVIKASSYKPCKGNCRCAVYTLFLSFAVVA